jgi:CIC family chloride channel protein
MPLPRPHLSRADSRIWRRILLSILIGVLAGLAARFVESSLHLLIPHLIGKVARPAEATIFRFDPRLLLLPAVGGLLSGLITTFLCRPDPSHGTGILIDSFHRREGAMSLKDAALKAGAAVLVIALGGSVGKEAAIAVLGAAIGARVATLLGMTPRERRLYLLAGCAAGVGAIFQCPLGGALFSATVLYREPDIEADSLMPAIIASVVGYSTFMAFGGFGRRLLEGTGGLAFSAPHELVAYAILGCTCAAASIFFSLCLRAMDRVRRRSPLPRWAAPAAAGVLVGLIACAFPQVMDAGYQFIQNSLDHGWLGPAPRWLRLTLLFTLVVLAKCVATALMIGTNTAGGLFGPVVFIGGAVGAATGAALEAITPGLFPETLRQSLIPVGMAGVLAASLRVPLAAVVMVMEMTGSYGLIVPLMLTSVLAYAIGRRWGVYKEQAEGLEHSPAHAGGHLVGLLESWTVSDVMQRDWPHVVSARATLPQMVAMMATGTRPYFAVLDGARFLGIVSTGDIARAAEIMGPSNLIIAADIMTRNSRVVSPDTDLYTALGIFRERRLEVLPVVGRSGQHFLGMLSRSEIHRTLRQRLEEHRAQMLREHAGMGALVEDSELSALLSGLPQQHKGTVSRMPVPAELVGKSLRESDFRRAYGEVIGIHTAGGQLLSPPDPGRALQAEDYLIVLPK